MSGIIYRSGAARAGALVLALYAASCHSDAPSPSLIPTRPTLPTEPVGGGAPLTDGGTLPPLGTGSGLILTEGDLDPDVPPAALGLQILPESAQTIVVTRGQALPTVVFRATLDGRATKAAWTIDHGELGRIAPSLAEAATFTPTGTGSGTVTVRAGLNDTILERVVNVQMVSVQNGPDPSSPQIATDVGQITTGGGVGGVGGEGLGAAVTDSATLAALRAPTASAAAQGLEFLYPYDGTVFPRGLLAPLLMWDWAAHDADAIEIRVETTSGAFSWTGVFGRPPILTETGGAFIRHPIPEDVWAAATASVGASSTGGTDRLRVSLVVARNGAAAGPISSTWTIAPARLSGTIYYNSYGSQLAKNHGQAVGGDGRFGGAVLSIRVGDTAPRLTAGSDGGDAQCRTCHSVAARGSRLIVQTGDADYATSSAYDLDASGAATETRMTNGAKFPALTPLGDKALAPSGQLLALPDGDVLPSSGLGAAFTDLGTPAFSPDGSLVAFNPMAGTGVTNPRQKLVVMNFNGATNTFSNPTVVVDATGQPAAERPGWPAFLPDGRSLVFQRQSVAGSDGNSEGALYTRKGARAQIHWASASGGAVTALDRLNGTGYLPSRATPSSLVCSADGTTVSGIDPGHADDTNFNYEPTVNPIASGGYSWVVFTSRRMYGSVADIPPFCSDPRGVDLVENITTKKLWVAAIDVNGQPGADASHPAFYLPAQELLAGNSRAFWVLDPCRADGVSCETGDQCCNGFCQPGESGALVCSNTPPSAHCSMQQERCTTNADCCNSTNSCVGNFCTLAAPH
jgi:WD40-like Beta Propeller Repeat